MTVTAVTSYLCILPTNRVHFTPPLIYYIDLLLHLQPCFLNDAVPVIWLLSLFSPFCTQPTIILTEYVPSSFNHSPTYVQPLSFSYVLYPFLLPSLLQFTNPFSRCGFLYHRGSTVSSYSLRLRSLLLLCPSRSLVAHISTMV
jgi:hypothetical protein